MPSKFSRSRLPIFTEAAWQPEQYLAKIGATSFVKDWALAVAAARRKAAIERFMLVVAAFLNAFEVLKIETAHFYRGRVATGAVFREDRRNIFRKRLRIAYSGCKKKNC